MTLEQLNALVKRYNEEEEAKAKIIQTQEDNLDLRFAQLCAILANTFRKRKKPYSVKDFLPKKKEDKKQTPEEMIERIKLWNASMGGK